MFAAVVLVARWIWDAALKAAEWLVTRALILYVLTIVLPWVFRKFFVWGFDFIIKYGKEMMTFLTGSLQTALANAGMQTSVNLHLSGIGGYLADQIGLIDYISIISTSWGIYWMVYFTLRRWRFM